MFGVICWILKEGIVPISYLHLIVTCAICNDNARASIILVNFLISGAPFTVWLLIWMSGLVGGHAYVHVRILVFNSFLYQHFM